MPSEPLRAADAAATHACRRTADGVELALRLTPRADRERLDGVKRDAAGVAWLSVRVNAPPVDGAANAALLAFLSKRWRAPKSAFRFLSGETGREKRIAIACDAAVAERILSDVGDA